MKIRIKGNSLRYRLTKSDVEHFSRYGYLEETINFSGQCFTYALKSSSQTQLTSDFENNKITLFMPTFMVKEWEDTDKVGFEETAGTIYLLVEKDFKCLDNVAEDQSDNYPNPLSYAI